MNHPRLDRRRREQGSYAGRSKVTLLARAPIVGYPPSAEVEVAAAGRIRIAHDGGSADIDILAWLRDDSLDDIVDQLTVR